MSGGILDGLNDPEVMAIVAERQRVVARIAEQTGLSVKEAREALDDFETDLSAEGQPLN